MAQAIDAKMTIRPKQELLGALLSLKPKLALFCQSRAT
jgi:hypothetical protein